MVASSPFFPWRQLAAGSQIESSRTVGPSVQGVFIHVSEIPGGCFAARSSRELVTIGASAARSA